MAERFLICVMEAIILLLGINERTGFPKYLDTYSSTKILCAIYTLEYICSFSMIEKPVWDLICK